MNNTIHHKYFLLITFKKISLVALNSKKEIFFTKEILVEDLSIEDNFNSLEIFLNQNLVVILDKSLYLIQIFKKYTFKHYKKINLNFQNFK